MIQVHQFRTIDRAAVWLQNEAARGFCWYRGVPNSNFQLVPKVLRKDCVNTENNLYRGFIREAHALTGGNVPTHNHSVEWLPLMQHYGVPTRCLDWSASFLTAIFFAVAAEDGAVAIPTEDAAIWVLSPALMNKKILVERHGVGGHAGVVSDDVGFTRAYMRAGLYADKVLLPDAVAYVSPRPTARERAQKGAFTLHGTPSPLENDKLAHEFLRKVIIPSSTKKFLLELLFSMGVGHASLFPELPALARRLVARTL